MLELVALFWYCNPQKNQFRQMLDYQLEPEIYSHDILDALIDYLNQVNSSARIHLKLDTGMRRLGFLENDLPSLLLKLSNHSPNLEIASVFSHLASADDIKEDDFSKKQISQFGEMFDQIATILGYKPLKHILNTNGLARFP